MTLSTVSITNRDLASIKSSPRPVLISLLLNYVIMGGIMLLMARWLINDSEIWAGFVTLAAMPPAIAVMPYSYMLGGDTVFSLFGTTGLYLVALGLTPGIMILLLGADFINPAKLLLILVQLIVIPLAVSRLLLSRGLAQNVIKWRDTAINWAFFTTIYIIIGLNRQVFFEQPGILFGVIIIAIALTFGLGHAIDFIARRLNIDRSTTISWIIMGTRKNTSLTSVIALAFLSERATIPAAVLAMFAVLFIVWMGFYFKKQVK
jgi:BASS family bile acid:Na+ symporter